MAQTLKPQMPCLANVAPASTTSTVRFTHFARHFSIKDDVPPSFPYEPHRENSVNQIYYFEFRGHGAPPSDLGNPGDVWMDVRPGNYALYAYKNESWMPWPGPHKSKKNMFEHPLIPGRYLWCTKKAVLWYTADGIRKSASLQTRGEEDDFGRERYRTVGPMERGAGRGQGTGDDGTPRLPLRTAEQAIAKILDAEREEERGKRRRPRDDDPPASVRKRSIEPAPPPEPSPLALNTIALPRAPFAQPPPPQQQQQLPMQPQQKQQPPPPPVYPSPSSLSQALGGHSLAVSPSTSSAHPLPGSQQQTVPSRTHSLLPPAQPSSSPASVPATVPAHTASSVSATPLSMLAATAYPSPQSQLSPLDSPPDFARLVQSSSASSSSSSVSSMPMGGGRIEDELRRLREEHRRLASENARLHAENGRLNTENVRLSEECARAKAGGNVVLPPGAVEMLKEAAMSGRIQSLQAEVQEHSKARHEAENRLAIMQEQLSKITSMFHSPAQTTTEPSLTTPGPSPRLRGTMAET